MTARPRRGDLKSYVRGKSLTGPLHLGEMYPFFRMITQILMNTKRWNKYARHNRSDQLGLADAESIKETELEHLFDKMLLGGHMIAIEKMHGGSTSLELNSSQLYLAFILHGLGVALHGDTAYMDMTEDDVNEEEENFNRAVELLPDPVYGGRSHDYLKKAYRLSQERERAHVEGRSLSDVSVNGRFLWAVVIVTFFMKSLHEARYMNEAFVNTFYNMWDDVESLRREFRSFDEMIKPVLPMIGDYMTQYPRWEE